MPAKKTKIIYFLILPWFLFLLQGCEDDRRPFPYVPFDVTFDISTQLNNLPTGQYIIKDEKDNYGYGGLIIYRSVGNTFYAFDLACPFRPQNKCLLKEDDTFDNLMKCPCCGSSYQLANEGRPFNGPSTQPLKQYDAFYIEASNQLKVTN